MPEEALSLYRRACLLYRGDFLQEGQYEEWTTLERERLLGLYVSVATTAGEMLVEREQWDTAISRKCVIDVCSMRHAALVFIRSGSHR